MPRLIIQNLYYHADYSQNRHSRPINSTGGFQLINQHQILVQTNTDYKFDPLNVKPSIVTGNVTYNFSFVNISGSIGGPITLFNLNGGPKIAKVGIEAVVIRVVYISTDTVFTDGPGAIIDAFDTYSGSLVNNNFVTVKPDNIGATKEANDYGWISDENINDPNGPSTFVTALTKIEHTPDIINSVNAGFQKWFRLDHNKPELPPGDRLVLAANERLIALAFYKTVKLVPI